jgi:hypothetical protein
MEEKRKGCVFYYYYRRPRFTFSIQSTEMIQDPSNNKAELSGIQKYLQLLLVISIF